MLTVAMASMKGGVGKTTAGVHLGEAFARRGIKTLLIDMDTQGHTAKYLGQTVDGDAAYRLLTQTDEHSHYGYVPVSSLITRDVRANLDLIAGGPRTAAAENVLAERLGRERALAKRLREIWDEYHVCLIDVPPGLSIVSSVALFASIGVLIPVTPGVGPESGVKDLISRLESMKREVDQAPAIVGVVPNMVDMREKESRALLEFVKQFPHSEKIRRAVKMAEATRAGQTISEYDPSSPVAADYEALAVWTAQRMQDGEL